MTIVKNLTPHTIVVQKQDGTRVSFPPSGTVARATSTPRVANAALEGYSVIGLPKFGEVENLPEPGEQPGTVFLVSLLVAQAEYERNPSRTDVLAPATGPQDGVIRDAKGQIEAVTKLIGF